MIYFSKKFVKIIFLILPGIHLGYINLVKDKPTK